MNSPKSRKGTAADRGTVLRFPAPAPPPLEGASLWRRLIALGPGVVTGAANLDPSAIVTATVVGAAFGHSLLWVVLLCVPFLLTIFSVTARIGVETRQGLLDIVRSNYGRGWALAGAIGTIAVNMAVVIADLMAVSDALSIILRQEREFFVAVMAFSVWYILIFHDYRKITRFLVLLSLPLFTYLAVAVIVSRHDMGGLLGSVVLPRARMNADYVEGLVALFGSLLTPYILLWQVSSRSDPGHEPNRGDAHAATLVSILLCVSVVLAAAAVLHLANPVDMTTRQAAEALRPVAGDWGVLIFAIGIVGAGSVALPVLVASMCYDLAQAVGWHYGLSENPWEARSFYLLISVSILIAGIANYLPINPVKALYWSMVLAGIMTLPTLLFILFISNDRRIMRTVNTRWQNFWIGAASGAVVAAGVAYVVWKI
ncbi:MAG: divalent metal cation transporter [Acidobacteria bacterium]|nr:divalent metal cation transporter [Acidobacteriota bacterium]